MRALILGNGRSGSSMLGMMLGSHPECHYVGEAYHMDYSLLSNEKRKRLNVEGMCGVCGSSCNDWAKMDGGKIFIDSSKLVGWAKRCDPTKTRFIRITRNVYDRLGSFKKKKGKITKEIIQSWMKHEREIGDFLYRKHYYEIKYEDLCLKRGLDDVCKFLGIDFDSDMYDFWNTFHHPIRGNSLTNMLVAIRHGVRVYDNLSPKEKEFMDNIGFNVVYFDRTKYLDDKDRRLIKKLGADKINRELGYE